MSWLFAILGWGLILLALSDIFFTVLYPRTHKGVLSVAVSRGLWWLFQQCAANVLRHHRDELLSYSGPTILVAIVIVWISLLMGGFALIVFPHLSGSIGATSGATPTDFATALYYSGYALTTLGTGDIVPKTSFFRLLLILEAVVGLTSLTLTLTYFQSVYNALIRRNAFALSLHHRCAGTADAAELLSRLGAGNNFENARADIADMADELQNLLESDHTYPILHYFRFREHYYALPRMLLLAMDTVTLTASALSANKHYSLIHSAAVAELWGGGMQLLLELSESFLPKDTPVPREQPVQEWRVRYYEAAKQLQLAGIETAKDIEAGADVYVSLRWKWGPLVVALAEYLGHEWSEMASADPNTAIYHLGWEREPESEAGL